MRAIAALLLLAHFRGYLAYDIVGVENGAPWGDWGMMETCPHGSKVVGISLKVEEPQGSGDDTALNAIGLHCYDKSTGEQEVITSSEGPWGTWGGRLTCIGGGIPIAFALRVEPRQGSGDDTAVNNLKLKCSDGETVEGYGTGWGSWGSFSAQCPQGFCGIQTKVESPQGSGDDTSLNDVRMLCC